MNVASQSNAPANDHDTDHAKAFKLRGGSFTLLILQLIDLKNPNFFQWLLDKIAQAPNFYNHAPVVLDLHGLADAGPFNFAELARRLRQHKLVPVGVQNGTEEQNQGATNAGMSVFPMWREGKEVAVEAVGQKPAKPQPAESGPAESGTTEPGPAESGSGEQRTGQAAEPETRGQAAAPPTAMPYRGDSKVVSQPVRSGRQIYAQGGELIVLSTVSAGAELLADGHVHVYGALRGRALAGVSGDTNARIFCQSLNAELISVAGHWLVSDDIDERMLGRAVQIYLKGGGLVIEPLD